MFPVIAVKHISLLEHKTMGSEKVYGQRKYEDYWDKYIRAIYKIYGNNRAALFSICRRLYFTFILTNLLNTLLL